MSLTLAEASKYSNDVLVKGVYETIIYESDTLAKLPFVEINGNGLTYDRESTASGVAWHAVNDTWTESTATVTQATASLTILGGDADVDNFLQTTRSNIQDLTATQIELKSKAVAQEFDNKYINGDGTANAPSGLNSLVATGQLFGADGTEGSTGAAGATLTLAMMDTLVDRVKPGAPDVLVMSKRSRRKLTQLRRAMSAAVIETSINEFGKRVSMFDGLPISINEWISDAETVGANTDCSRIYAVCYGEDAVCGLTNGWIQVIPLGDLETKDAKRVRIRWYTGLALFNTLKLAVLGGVRD